MAQYIDGFIIPVPKKNMKAYRKIAKTAAKVWLKCGALEYFEAEGDDIGKGKITSFPRSVKLKGNETVIFGYAIYKSRAHRDSVMAKVMKHEELTDLWQQTQIDGMRMIWGGFKEVVRA